MVESSGRGLLVFVPLLIGAWMNSVCAASQVAFCPTAFSATLGHGRFLSLTETSNSLAHFSGSDINAVAADFLKPPTELASTVSSSSRPRSLPAVPRSLLMVVLGFLCVSLVHDRRIWLTPVACLLPISHDRPNAIPGLPFHQRIRRRPGHVAPWGIAGLFKEQVPLSIRVHPVPGGHVKDREDPGVSAAIVYPQSMPDKPLFYWIANAGPVWLASPQLIFAQLARGPPLRTWRT